ncbi:MAG: hypothetical protein GXX96_10875 [Planctomycetaceae bacterium]|nr:hypothetical protein [Planctomycetaceae bacterium]
MSSATYGGGIINRRNLRRILALTVVVGCSSCNSPSIDRSDAWQTLRFLDESIQVDFPATPVAETQNAETEEGVVRFASHKAMVNGIFFNVLLATFPESTIEARDDKQAFLMQISQQHELAKAGARREYLRSQPSAAVPAIEHRYSYPMGTNNAGQQYAPGFAVWKTFLVDNTICSVFVDVVQSAYDSEPARVEEMIDKFFSSIEFDPGN